MPGSLPTRYAGLPTHHGVYIPPTSRVHRAVSPVHSRCVYTEHAGRQEQALEHGVTEQAVSGLLIYRHGVTVRCVTVHHRHAR